MYKRTNSRKVQYPCTVCSRESGDGTIQCSGCGEWTHAACLHVDEVYLQQFTEIDFYCPTCSTDKGDFVWDKLSIRRYVSLIENLVCSPVVDAGYRIVSSLVGPKAINLCWSILIIITSIRLINADGIVHTGDAVVDQLLVVGLLLLRWGLFYAWKVRTCGHLDSGFIRSCYCTCYSYRKVYEWRLPICYWNCWWRSHWHAWQGIQRSLHANPDHLARYGNRARQRLRPNDPTSLEFDYDEEFEGHDFLKADIKLFLLFCCA